MLNVDEIFTSIQGESTDSGLPCIFIRLYGCPVGCVYCDQKQNMENMKRMSLREITTAVSKIRGIKYVCITGGEPMMQFETMSLIFELQQKGYRVSIETSGCIPLEKLPYHRSFKYVMDIKCPSSGVSEKNVYENLIKLQFEDEVKFVIKDREDYNFMKKVLRKYPTQAKILVSPMFDENNEPLIGKELVEWLIEDKLSDIRVSLQIHKFLSVK